MIRDIPNFNNEQLDFLYALDYLSKGEIGDLILGYTSLEVLLDADNLEEFKKL